MPPCRTQPWRKRFTTNQVKCLAQFIKQFGPVAHLLVGKLDALRPYCIRCSGIGETRKAKVNKVGADGFFMERLAKKQSENKTELRGVMLLQTAVYKLVVLGKQPNIIVSSEMGEHPKRIDCHTAVGIKRKLIQFLFKTIVTHTVGRCAQLHDFRFRKTVSEEGFHICKSTTLNPNGKIFSENYCCLDSQQIVIQKSSW